MVRTGARAGGEHQSRVEELERTVVRPRWLKRGPLITDFRARDDERTSAAFSTMVTRMLLPPPSLPLGTLRAQALLAGLGAQLAHDDLELLRPGLVLLRERVEAGRSVHTCADGARRQVRKVIARFSRRRGREGEFAARNCTRGAKLGTLTNLVEVALGLLTVLDGLRGERVEASDQVGRFLLYTPAQGRVSPTLR